MMRTSMMGLIGLVGVMVASCYREPLLHLYDMEGPTLELPIVDLRLELLWNYSINLGINYDWRTEWYYGQDDENGPGWDEEDKRIFGELEYKEPNTFFLRRYYTGNISCGPRIDRKKATISGRSFRSSYDWGFWDILAWNDIEVFDPLDPVQSLHFEEPSSYDEPITAYTEQSMYRARYHAPRYPNAFFQPEQLFSACQQGIEINESLDGFDYDEKEKIWIRTLNMPLRPVTYIYLPQIILRNNNGRIKEVVSTANISGMARTTTLNTGIAGDDAIAVNFKMRLKKNKDMNGEKVDIVGGRLMTFGICGQNGHLVNTLEEVKDKQSHYLDVTLRFNNDMDSTFVFNVTDSVRSHWRGGVITVKLDMKDVPTPVRPGGSGFNAVVKDMEDAGTWEFDM